MKKIKIRGIEGYYYVEDDYLCHYSNDLKDGGIIEDLSSLYIYQYNELVKNLWVYYPDYNINKLEGRFI